MRKLLALLALFFFTACSQADAHPNATKATADMTPDTTLTSELALLRGSRILFSHHSVGRDLLAGMQRLAGRSGAEPLTIFSIEDAQRATGPGLIDISGGQNGDPASKLAFFADTLKNEQGLRLQLAFMKLCFVDFNPSTDVNALFAKYEAMIGTVKREHPEITFGHVTVPLMRSPDDFASRLKRLLGREVWEDAANVKRGTWNERLLRTFASDPIFDLARVESTRPDGSRASFTEAGATYFSLAPAYTEDGGHLNELGQNVAGREMIRFIAQALRARTAPQ